ncbi:MAG: sigma-54 dependent transcriptional regulator [Betaproteobacteria bacterium]|jgi:DNA-binding NtrC family response regulator|nr:sigma-54 dependent transcriptional regulator [Betaproteobacteria bacterium]
MTRRILVLQGAGSSIDLCSTLVAGGWEVQQVSDIRAALVTAATNECTVGLAVLDQPDSFEQSDLARLVSATRIEWVVVLTKEASRRQDVATLISNGFHDFHTLPLDAERLLVVLGHASGKAELKRKLTAMEPSFKGRYGMVGRSPAMLELYRAIDKIVRVDAPVLIAGESGTGKEVAARAIHNHSARRSGPFVPVNCGALPTNLVQSELFGHEKGAFTGAHQRKQGSIEAASGGTVFLDEIGDLPLESQSSLLRFLQEKTIVRVGSTLPQHIDARVIAASHVDLADAVRQGRFREDLYYRLNVLHLEMPPLRERAGDIGLLADEVFEKHGTMKAPDLRGFSSEARVEMELHPWPGNVRELINRVQKAMIMCEGRLITPLDLGLAERHGANSGAVSLQHARHSTERDLILAALERNRQNVAATARELGVSRVTLYRLIQKLAIARSSVIRPDSDSVA